MPFWKRFILWDFSRETSVYVIFCLLIVAFIFLTPKSWFDKRERLATQISRLNVQSSDFSSEKSVLEKRVRELSGDPDAVVLDWSKKTNEKGEVFYEIDLR